MLYSNTNTPSTTDISANPSNGLLKMSAIIFPINTKINTELLIIGYGANKKTIHNFIKRHKLEKKIRPLISQDVLTITSEGKTTIDDNLAYILRATGEFENLNDDVREIGFEAITGTATAPISVGRQMLDLDNRINSDIYSEVNRAGLVPKNMINDDLDTQL